MLAGASSQPSASIIDSCYRHQLWKPLQNYPSRFLSSRNAQAEQNPPESTQKITLYSHKSENITEKPRENHTYSDESRDHLDHTHKHPQSQIAWISQNIQNTHVTQIVKITHIHKHKSHTVIGTTDHTLIHNNRSITVVSPPNLHQTSLQITKLSSPSQTPNTITTPDSTQYTQVKPFSGSSPVDPSITHHYHNNTHTKYTTISKQIGNTTHMSKDTS